jgi:hypothetical protein
MTSALTVAIPVASSMSTGSGNRSPARQFVIAGTWT